MISIPAHGFLTFSKRSPIFAPDTKDTFCSIYAPSFLFSHKKPPARSNSVKTRVNSLPRSENPSLNPYKTQIHHSLILFAFSFIILCLRLFSNALLPDFRLRWLDLMSFSVKAEAKSKGYPKHLLEAVVAYEDRRFFSHFGIDPIGIGRAVLSLSARGGGSTITQQLVKNAFLKNERTVSRKIVEMVLAVVVERRLSKQRLLSSYLSKIYWGHGIYGIEAASSFYFGKHPSVLSLGESAMLAGMIPAPEVRSPLRDLGRGKKFQARVLKRMVEVGCLDVEMALLIAKQCLNVHVDRPHYDNELLHMSSFPMEGFVVLERLNQIGTSSTCKHIWDWERESKVREAWEDFERWALQVH